MIDRFLQHPYWKHYADFLILGITLHVCTLSDAIAWADCLIEKSELPAEWMIALSVSTTDCHDSAICSLKSVPGKANAEVSFRLLLARIGERYPTLFPERERFFQPEHRRLFICLYHLSRRQTMLPEPIQSCIAQLYHDMDYVEEGYGDWTIIQQDYAELLAFGELDTTK